LTRGFQRNGYAVKLAAAHARFQQALPNLEIRFGQAALFYLGFNPGPIDGFVGPRTRAALIAFQRKRSLPVTGRMDERMLDALCMAAF
jgi:peptidoglycan hydrolase-like protein with peptidoglycan-binding domain